MAMASKISIKMSKNKASNRQAGESENGGM